VSSYWVSFAKQKWNLLWRSCLAACMWSNIMAWTAEKFYVYRTALIPNNIWFSWGLKWAFPYFHRFYWNST
jgi:hypothetical protein